MISTDFLHSLTCFTPLLCA